MYCKLEKGANGFDYYTIWPSIVEVIMGLYHHHLEELEKTFGTVIEGRLNNYKKG